MFVYILLFFLILLHTNTITHIHSCAKSAHLRRTHLLGGEALPLISPQRKPQRADLYSRAVIDEDPQSRRSHGKNQFVYSALSPGSLWHFDLYHADVHHRFLIWSLAPLTQAALLLSIQCILMKRREGEKNLAPDLTAGLTQRWERRARG